MNFRLLTHAEVLEMGIDLYEDDECQDYIVDFRNPDKPAIVASDYMPAPEDARFRRDLRWILVWLNELSEVK